MSHKQKTAFILDSVRSSLLDFDLLAHKNLKLPSCKSWSVCHYNTTTKQNEGS